MIVIANKSGQLGNRLFLFAHVAAYALERGYRVSNPSFDEYSQYFEWMSKDVFCRIPLQNCYFKPSPNKRFNFYTIVARLVCWLLTHLICSRLHEVVSIDWSEAYNLDSRKFQFAVSKNVVFLWGWRFRDHDSFLNQAEQIRYLFKPIAPIEQKTKEIVESLRLKAEIIVGVHIRQGDYADFFDGRYHYSTVEYVALMHQVEQQFADKKVGFIVCSNVSQDRKNFSSFCFSFGSGHIVEDMYTFAKCDYLIGPPSTYTSWASFYGYVPLYKIYSTSQVVDFNQFRVNEDGHCDDFDAHHDVVAVT